MIEDKPIENPKPNGDACDFLFSIVRDHPEIIGEGLAEIHLAALAPRLKHAAVAEDARSLKRFASRLERIDAFSRKNLKKKTGRVVEEIEYSFETIDFITQKEVAKYADEYFWDDECGYIELAHRRMGYEMQIRIRYKGDQTLQKVVERIDETILPIKPYLEMIYRFGKSRWPF